MNDNFYSGLDAMREKVVKTLRCLKNNDDNHTNDKNSSCDKNESKSNSNDNSNGNGNSNGNDNNRDNNDDNLIGSCQEFLINASSRLSCIANVWESQSNGGILPQLYNERENLLYLEKYLTSELNTSTTRDENELNNLYKQIESLTKKANDLKQSMKIRQENLNNQLKESKIQIQHISNQYNQFDKALKRCKRWIGNKNNKLNENNNENTNKNTNTNKNKSKDDENANENYDDGLLITLENEFDKLKHETLRDKCQNIKNCKNWNNNKKIEYLQNAIKFVLHNKMMNDFKNIVNCNNNNNNIMTDMNDINVKRKEIREKIVHKEKNYCENVESINFRGKSLSSLNATILKFNDIKSKDATLIVMFLLRKFATPLTQTSKDNTNNTTKGNNDSDNEDSGKCIICMANDANMVYTCGHLSLCYTCYQEWSVQSKFCPDCMCKETDSTKAIKLFKSGFG